MFPLAGRDFPTSADALASAIGAAFAERLTTARDRPVVTIAGGTFPAVGVITVNLDGSTVTGITPPPTDVTGERDRHVTVGRFDVSAQPIQYRQAKLNLTASGSGLAFAFSRDIGGQPLLVLTGADRGHVEATVTRADLRALLLAVVTPAAAAQGVAVQDLQVDVASDGPRSVTATVRVKARKMMMTGVVVLTGRVDVDEGLNATVSHLACKGEGLVGIAAASFLQKQIDPVDGMQVPLLAFSLGDVALHDLSIAIGDAIHVSAAFGTRR